MGDKFHVVLCVDVCACAPRFFFPSTYSPISLNFLSFSLSLTNDTLGEVKKEGDKGGGFPKRWRNTFLDEKKKFFRTLVELNLIRQS